MSTFYVNSTLEIELKVRRRNGDLYTPTGVRITVTKPDETSSTYTWGIDSALEQATDDNDAVIPGTFLFTYTPTLAGRHTYVFETYGDVSSKIKNMFHVERT